MKYRCTAVHCSNEGQAAKKLEQYLNNGWEFVAITSGAIYDGNTEQMIYFKIRDVEENA